MTTQSVPAPVRIAPGASVLIILALLAFLNSVFEYFWPANGIHGTEGALLVVVSTLLTVIAAAIIAGRLARGWVRVVLEVLIFLDLLGTGVAAYFLEAWILLALDVLALLAFLVQVTRPRRTALAESAP